MARRSTHRRHTHPGGVCNRCGSSMAGRQACPCSPPAVVGAKAAIVEPVDVLADDEPADEINLLFGR